MIKLIIFDLDGVLVDAKEIHYNSLNSALAEIDDKYIITREDHLSIFDGLPTNEKLKLLTEIKGLPTTEYDKIWKIKQEKTSEIIKLTIFPDGRLTEVLSKLKKDGFKIYVASNSIHETVKLALLRTGLLEYIDYFFSNEDVKNPKPNPEIYLRAMAHAGVRPKETLIVEDSIHGRQAAIDSGGLLLGVDHISDVTYNRIYSEINKKILKKNMWNSNNITVLVPMAGAGSRFSKAGFTFPKPLIEVRNKPMIQVVVENLNINCNFIYLVQKAHYEKYNLKHLLNLTTPNCEIVIVDGITEGAACTTLLAKEHIDNDNHLIIANSDQFVEWNSNSFYYSLLESLDGTILTFESTHPKWSFVTENKGLITEVAEKKPISNIATVGIYHWKRGSDYVRYAEQMIERNLRVNNEFYVAPVYNLAIQDGLKFKKFQVERMWGIGTPEDLDFFVENYQGEL